LRSDVANPARALRRLRREARMLAGLSSEHLVSVFDCGELEDGSCYLVMERLVGSDLRTRLRGRRPLSFERAVAIGIDACRGLGVLHGAGLVHRDLKPANVFLARRSDGTQRAVILDLGVAKDLCGERTEGSTLIGTIRYMAPEQLADAGSVGPRADIYALGAILYQCFTGLPPHAASERKTLMSDVMHREIPRAGELCPGLPPAIDDLLMRMLSRNPKRRPRDAAEVLRELAPFAEMAPEPAPRSRRQRRRPKLSKHATALSFLLGATLGALCLWRPSSDACREGQCARQAVPGVVPGVALSNAAERGGTERTPALRVASQAHELAGDRRGLVVDQDPARTVLDHLGDLPEP
jgi:serine/threonine-protein kinase